MKRIVLFALFLAVVALAGLPALHAQDAPATAEAVATTDPTALAIELGIAPAAPLADCTAQATVLPQVSFAAEGPLPNPNPCRFVCLCCARLGSGSGCCADCDACLAGN